MASESEKVCEHCNNPIPEDALLCLYCGEGVHVESGFLGSLKYSLWGWLAAAIALVVLAAFVANYVL